MTIKQQGGVFGRNPTFNDVTADGDVTLNGATEIRGEPARLTITNTDFSVISPQEYGSVDFVSEDGSLQNGRGTIARIVARNSGGSGAYSSLDFYTSQGTTPSNLKHMLEIDYQGNVRIKRTANLVFEGAGGGIDFSATSGTGTSELFDDYEEGTWTPTYLLTTTDFDSITYDAVRYGAYTKIGNKVFCTVSIRTDAITVGAGAGSLAIGGLPFTVLAGAANNASSGLPGYYASWASNPGGVYPTAGQTYAIIGIPGTTSGATSAILNTGANSNFISLQFFYTAA